MSFLGKEYVLVSHNHFNDFLKAYGLPDDVIQEYLSSKASTKVQQSGDQYTAIYNDADGTKEVSFKSGVEFDDVLGREKTPVKATYVVDGNTLTQTIKTDKGSLVSKGEYNGNDLVVTLTSDTFSNVAKLFYKA